MVQEYKIKIGIIGAGPAGCFCACNLKNFANVTLFDIKEPLITLLPTGGGRCNLAYNEYDFKELAKFYPKGEKFLYSVFSQFATAETLDFFKKIGVNTYIQQDGRIFPVSNSAKDVREKFLASLKGVIFKKEEVLKVQFYDDFEVATNKNKYHFDKFVIATGGHASYDIIKNLGHNIIPPKPSLTELKTDKIYTSGVTLKNVRTKIGKIQLQDDLLLTHHGISGPLAFKISSINARENFPYKIHLDLTGEIDLQKMFDINPHKSLKNLLAEFLPKSFAFSICPEGETKCSQVNSMLREKIYKQLREFELTVIGICSGEEKVTCGGVDLDEVNNKTMMSKIVPNLYFCGEVLNIDGFCGGFNLQNCWSTAFVASKAIISQGK